MLCYVISQNRYHQKIIRTPTRPSNIALTCLCVCFFASWKICILWCGIHFNTCNHVDHSKFHSSKVGFGELSLNNWGDVPHLGGKINLLEGHLKMKLSVAPSVQGRPMQQGSKNPWFDFDDLQKEAKESPMFFCLQGSVPPSVPPYPFIHVPLRNTWTSGTQEMNPCMVSAAFHSRIGNTRSLKRSRCHKWRPGPEEEARAETLRKIWGDGDGQGMAQCFQLPLGMNIPDIRYELMCTRAQRDLLENWVPLKTMPYSWIDHF